MVWPCHEESVSVNTEGFGKAKVKMKGKRPRGRLRWLDIIDSHLKGKNTSLKERIETKCFEKLHYWGTLISGSTDRSGEVLPRSPT